MRHLGLILLFAAPLACDLNDRSIGDSGNNADDDGDGDSNDDGGDPSNDNNCTEIGCDDAVFLTLSSSTGTFDDGVWSVLMEENASDRQFGCEFTVTGGAAGGDCFVFQLPEGIQLQLPADLIDVTITVFKERAVAGQLQPVLDYEEVAPNGFECGPICLQAQLTMTVDGGVATCDGLEADFLAEVETVRGCTDANECGQVIEGTSCGCTHDWVARLDADLGRFEELAAAGGELQCDWALFASDCDCPQADGFDCIDNRCEWNYVGG